jgi:hypothetical protein
MRAAVLCVVLSSLALVACGSNHSSHSGSSASAAQSGSGGAPRALPPDVVAYIEIARASGALRGSAAAAALGHATHLSNAAALASFVPRVAGLRPTDVKLAALRDTMRSALGAALAAGRGRAAQQAAAGAAVRATDAVNRALRGYAAKHPQLASLIPD